MPETRSFTAPELTVPDLLTGAVATVPDNVALDFLGATTTYRELAAQVDRAAALLSAAGVRAGDRVALVLPNCPQHVVAFYAVLRLGAVVAEHNPLASPAELRAQDRKSTRLNSSHVDISVAVLCMIKQIL